jgi:glycosyltransferase involved in cell wall biosynthesis
MHPHICLIPKLKGLGGTASFQAKLIQGLEERDIPWTFDVDHPQNTAILVIAGTRHLWKLNRTKQKKVRVVQRLDGINWIHKIEKTPPRAYLRAEINNLILAFIRRHLANQIVYQSQFSQEWWNREFGERSLPSTVVYNGVDLQKYSPVGEGMLPEDHFRILLVEGHLSGAYARGLETAVRLAESVREKTSRTLELMVVGDVDDSVKAHAHTLAPDLWITWGGVVPREAIPALDRSAHVLFSADLNAACPNSVIEALACGCPVVAYQTGSLAELVQDGAGEVVPYGSDYWQLEKPLIQPLADACMKILENNTTYRKQARKRAESQFGLDAMVEAYLEALVKE